jgi:hypothetical protein
MCQRVMIAMAPPRTRGLADEPMPPDSTLDRSLI